MEYIKRKLKEIHPYENNPRIIDSAVDDVAESIRQCSYITPILIDEDGVLLAGHTRHVHHDGKLTFRFKNGETIEN